MKLTELKQKTLKINAITCLVFLNGSKLKRLGSSKSHKAERLQGSIRRFFPHGIPNQAYHVTQEQKSKTMEKVNSETDMQTPNTLYSEQEKCAASSMRSRWYFYLALLLIPVLTILVCNAITNFYNTRIDSWAYHDRFYVSSQNQDPIPSQILYEEARKYLPASAILVSAKIDQAPDRSAHFKFKVNGLYNQSIFLNPYTGEVLGVLDGQHSNTRFWVGTVIYWLVLLLTCWLALRCALRIERCRSS